MIKKVVFLILFLLFLLIIIAGAVKEGIAFEAPGTVVINVDSSQSLGEMPVVLRPGLMGIWWNKFQPLKSELEDLEMKPFLRFHFGIGTDSPGGNREIKPDNFEENFKEWLNKVVNPQIKLYQDAGSQIIISLTQVPKWLALYPYDECMPYADGSWFLKWPYSPPNDYVEYDNLIKLLIQAQKDDGIKADYIIGDEPSWMFYGTEEQYLEMYSHAAKAIKEVDLNIKVGGPGTCWECRKDANCPAEATGLEDGECPPQDHTMIKALIGYVAENSLPLDFIDWHFPWLPSLENTVNTTRNWLREAGLSENIPLTIGEWVYSSKNEEESTERASAYTINLLKALLDNGIQRYTATSIYDQRGWTSGNWAHVGFFSDDGIIKAKWNSFKAIDKLSSQRIKAETTDEDHIIAISSKDNEKIAVVISNFITKEEAALQAAMDSFSEQSETFTETCIETIDNGQQVLYNLYTDYLFDQITIEDIEEISVKHCGSFPEYLRNDLINSKQIAHQVYLNEIPYQPDPREVELKITNINPGTYTYKRYIIDGDMEEIHSNPCRYNKKTEPTPTDTECGIDGVIDQAVVQAKDDSITTASYYLLDIGYSNETVDEFLNCLEEIDCSPDDLVEIYCQQYPAYCGKIKADLNEAKNLGENLFYHGTYTAPNDITYTIPTCVDQINNLKEVSLEGSKQEKLVTITDGTYIENLTMQPYSVVLIEFEQ